MPRILAVDDQPEITQLVKRILRFSNHEVITADSGTEAIKLLNAQNFSLLITDKNMPDLSGLTVIAEARKLQPGISAIIMTAYPEPGLQNHAEGFLAKPFSIKDLERVVAGVLSQLKC